MNSVRAFVVLALLVVAASPARAQQQYQAPAEPPVLLPWKVGQWASYRLTTPTTESTVTVRILAEDGCGVWFEISEETNDSTLTARTCLARTPQGTFTPKADGATILSKDGEITDIKADNPARTRALDKVLRADWAGKRGLPREDVTLQSGTTILSLKESPTRWSHPSVPLGGLVRDADPNEELLLIDHGVRDASVVYDDAQSIYSKSRTIRFYNRTKNKWMTFGFGTDLLGNLDRADWTDTFSVTLGYNFTPRIAIALNTTQTGLAPHPELPVLAETLVHVTLGLRWYPYANPQRVTRWSFLSQGVYAQLDLGYAQLARGRLLMSDGIAGRGGIAGLRIGYATGLTRDWKLAVELHEHTALLNSDETERITLGLLAIVELYL